MVIVVIGGGPAGMMAAAIAAQNNPKASVFLLEKNEKLGKKLFLSGKGRGNLTNYCSLSEFPDHYHSNPRFLYSALHAFSNLDLMAFMEKYGCMLKVERGKRVFPVTDRAYSITDALKKALKKFKVHIMLETKVLSINTINSEETGNFGKGFIIRTNKKDYEADKVIIATGGLSYPSTGSTGDGFRLLNALGDTLGVKIRTVPCAPSLVPLLVDEEDCYLLRGLQLKNVSVSLSDDKGKIFYKDFGEVYFLEHSLSGPLILSASAYVTKKIHNAGATKSIFFTINIDLKPSVSSEILSQRIKRELEELHGADAFKVFTKLLPRKLIPVFLKRLLSKDIDLKKRASEVTRKEREAIISLMKNFCFTIRNTGAFREAIVTQGGIDVLEINPRTMELKSIPDVYIAGEMLDVDGFTGGFNLQAAFSTGYLAGLMAAGS